MSSQLQLSSSRLSRETARRRSTSRDEKQEQEEERKSAEQNISEIKVQQDLRTNVRAEIKISERDVPQEAFYSKINLIKIKLENEELNLKIEDSLTSVYPDSTKDTFGLSKSCLLML